MLLVLAARENGLWACGTEESGARREANLCKAADAQREQEESGWRVS